MKYQLKQASKQGVFFLILTLALLQSCNQKLNQSESPTAPSVSAKADSTSQTGASKRKAVSSVIPLIPSYQQGAIAYGGTEWFLVNWVPATSHNGTYTMVDPNGCSSDQWSQLYQHYGFQCAIVNVNYVSELTSVGFSRSDLLVGIGSHGLDANWQDELNQYTNTVMGYFIDEPSGFIDGATMQNVKTAVHNARSTLWLDDYDTGVISSILYVVQHNYHLADVPMLDNADCVMCDADNSYWVSGEGGIGCYVGEDYNEFQGWFGGSGQPLFNTIFTMPPYTNQNVPSVVDWASSHLGNHIAFFALYLPAGWSWSDVDGFAQYAYQAGFLGQYQLLEQAKYVCLQNNVTFVPTSSDVEGTYYGVLDNGSYTGPVDPSTSGATACWSIQTWVSQNQYQTIYAQ